MYNINRQQAADILGISTRSIDRYIKSGKIRSKKDGKIVLLHNDDINILNSGAKVVQNVIVSDDKVGNSSQDSKNSQIVKKEDYDKIVSTFEKIYSGLKEEIKLKDEKIQDLSVKLGELTQNKNNSIDLIEYKKVQFLSEQSKTELSKKLEKEISLKQKTVKELKYEKNTNKLLVIFIFIIFMIFGIVFFVGI